MTRTIVAALLLLAFVVPAAAEDDDAWREKIREGEWAVGIGDYQRAEAAFRAALDIAGGFPEGDPRLEESLANLARFYDFRNRIDEAQPLYELLLVARESRLGERDPALLGALRAAGRVAMKAGDVPSAVDHLERYAEIADASGAVDPEELANVLALLSRTYVLQERGEEALGLQRRVAAATDPEDDPELYVERLETLAQLELAHGDPEEAERRLAEAATILGSGGATALAAAAATAVAHGHPETAERLAERALELAEDPADPALLPARIALGDAVWLTVRRATDNVADLLAVAEDTEDLRRAARILEGLLQVQEELDLPGRLETLRRLAAVAAMRGDLDAVRAWQARVVALTPPASADRVRELSPLVDLHLRADATRAAADTNARLIATLEELFGDDSPKLLFHLDRQRSLLKDLGERREAKAIKKRIKQIERGR